jgi:hypothetical protein
VNYCPIFETVEGDAALGALIGLGGTMRLYPFGRAAQVTPPTYPYVVWQNVSGAPENYINRVPEIDLFSIQVDIYSKTAESGRAVAGALRDAIQTSANISGWRGETRDPQTGYYRVSFDVDWFSTR